MGQVRERLDQIEEGYRERADANAHGIHRLSIATMVILGALAAALITLGIISINLSSKLGTQTTNARTLAKQAKDLAQEIQNQRKALILKTCQDQNRRHNHTIKELKVLVAKMPLPPGVTRQQEESNLKGTILIISALAPHQNCKQLVKAST